MASKEFQEAAHKLGFVPAFLPGKEFGQVIATDDKEIGTLMKQIGIQKKKM